MAARPEHEKGYYYPKAILKRAWKKSGAVDVVGYVPYVINPFNTKHRDVPDALATAIGGFLVLTGLGANAIIGAHTPEYIEQTNIVPPVIDESVSFSDNLSAENGYIAVSSNNGNSGYALFNNDGDYRLYEVNRDGSNSELTLVSDADEAWRISYELDEAFGYLSDAVSDELTTDSGQNWQVMTLPDLSVYAKNDNDDIVRFSARMEDYDEQNGWPLIEQYSDVQQIWQDAAKHFVHHDASIPKEEFAENAGVITTETYQVENEKYDSEMMAGHVFSAIGGALFVLGAIPPIVRRRRYLQNKI
jgi:hypothetical protein